MPPTADVSIDLKNVQGLLHHFYPCSFFRYLLFHFNSPADGRTFLRSLVPLVTPAVSDDPSPVRFLNVGISYEGLQALALDDAILREFPEDFKEGPSAIVMGDFGDSAPEHWWHERFQTGAIHALVQLSCKSDDDRNAFTTVVRGLAAQAGVTELLPTSDNSTIDAQYLGNGRLHFGYRDGISEPDVAWADGPDVPKQTNFRQFLLGYSTPEISSSPKAVASRPKSAEAAALVRDGSYAVFKWIYQDVARFNAFLEAEAPQLMPDKPPADAQELLAAKLLGRWRDGTPLVLSPDAPESALVTANDFTYNDTDPDGLKCPFSAHIRVVNPRDQELNFAEFGIVPRVIRRGSPFGPPLEGTVDDGKLRGLVGVFLCASISAQVYKLMAWMKRTDFSPKFTNSLGQDPLASRKVPGASTTYQIATSATARVTIGLADFTRTLGTAFFFVPGLAGLSRLSEE